MPLNGMASGVILEPGMVCNGGLWTSPGLLRRLPSQGTGNAGAVAVPYPCTEDCVWQQVALWSCP